MWEKWEKKVGGGPTTSAGPKTQPTSVGKRTLVEQLQYAPPPPAAVPKNSGDASHPPADDRALGDPPGSALPPGEPQSQTPTDLAIARSATTPPPASVPPQVSSALASAQGAPLQQPSKAQTNNDVLRSLDESIAILPSIEKSGAVFGMGKNPTVASLAPLRTQLTERRAKIATAANDKDALAWAGQVDSQQSILTQVSFGFDRHAKRLADLTKMVTDSAIKLGGFNLPPHVRGAMNHVAMGYADIALLSELPATAAPKLAAVEDEAGLLPVTFLEGTLEAIQRTIDDARDAKHDATEHASYGVDDMRARQQALKARLAALRIRVKTDPEGATKELADIGKLTDGLQQESEIVGNLDSIDAAWSALDDGASWFWSFPTTTPKPKISRPRALATTRVGGRSLPTGSPRIRRSRSTPERRSIPCARRKDSALGSAPSARWPRTPARRHWSASSSCSW
jgi:hypothetical protein